MCVVCCSTPTERHVGDLAEWLIFNVLSPGTAFLFVHDVLDGVKHSHPLDKVVC